MGPHVTALASGLVAFVLLALQFRRAARFVMPDVRVDADAPPDQVSVPEALAPCVAPLSALGFRSVGTHEEQGTLGPQVTHLDLVDGGTGAPVVFASVFVDGDAGLPKVEFWSPFGDGGVVVTANHPRIAQEWPGVYRAGGLEGAHVDRVFKAHLKRCEGLAVTDCGRDQDARVALARAFWRGTGRRELRRQSVSGLLWCAGAVAILTSALGGWLGSLK